MYYYLFRLRQFSSYINLHGFSYHCFALCERRSKKGLRRKIPKFIINLYELSISDIHFRLLPTSWPRLREVKKAISANADARIDEKKKQKSREFRQREQTSYIIHDGESVVKLSENSTLDKTF